MNHKKSSTNWYLSQQPFQFPPFCPNERSYELDLNLARKKVEYLANFSAPFTKDGEIKFSYVFFFFLSLVKKEGTLQSFQLKPGTGLAHKIQSLV